MLTALKICIPDTSERSRGVKIYGIQTAGRESIFLDMPSVAIGLLLFVIRSLPGGVATPRIDDAILTLVDFMCNLTATGLQLRHAMASTRHNKWVQDNL